MSRRKRTAGVHFGPFLTGVRKNPTQQPDAFSLACPPGRKCDPNLGAVCIAMD
jgi:hypothetical protein